MLKRAMKSGLCAGLLCAGLALPTVAQERESAEGKPARPALAGLKAGDLAPDFELPLLDTNTIATGMMPENPTLIRLSAMTAKKRPVVLIFSSFT